MSDVFLIWGFLNFIQISGLFLLARSHGELRRPQAAASVPFWDDYFFVIWNSFCAIISLYYWYFINLNPESILDSAFVYVSLPEGILGFIVALLIKIDESNFIYIFYSIIAIIGVKTQFRNISRETTYWWNIKHCRLCWYIRLVFLSGNMFIVALVSWKLAIFTIKFFAFSHGSDLNVDIFHRDSYASFYLLGHAFVITNSVFMIRAFVGVLGIYDHTRVRNIDFTYIVGDVYNILYGLFALSIFVFFSSVVKNAVEPLLEQMHRKIYEACNFSSGSIDFISCGAKEIEILNFLKTVSSIPFSFEDFGFVLFVWIFPILFQIFAAESRRRL